MNNIKPGRLSKTPKNIRDATLDWVTKQGYPLELECQKILVNRKYTCTAGNLFTDYESKKEREIDLSCYKYTGSQSRFLFQIDLQIECKYAKHPWVVFQSQNGKGYDFPNAGIVSTNQCDMLYTRHALTPDWLFNFASSKLLFPDRIGHGIAQSNKPKKEDGDISYRAISSALKASIHAITRRNSQPVVANGLIISSISFPIVVIEGILYGCHLSDAELNLESIEWAALRWSGELPVNGRPFVYVMTKQYLEHFLTKIEKISEFIDSCIGKSKFELDREVDRKIQGL